MSKTSTNFTFYPSSAFDTADVQGTITNTTGPDIAVADNIIPVTDNVFNIGSDTKRWNTLRSSLTSTNEVRAPTGSDLVVSTTSGGNQIRPNRNIVPLTNNLYSLGSSAFTWQNVFADTVALSTSNYLILTSFTKVYTTPDTLDPLDPPLLFLPSLAPSVFDGGFNITDGNMIKYPSKGLYLIQFDLSWDTTKFVPIPSGMLEFRMTNTIDGRFANDVMSSGFMHVLPTPVFSVPLFFNASQPLRFEVMWTCLDVNERIKLTLVSNESIFGLKLAVPPTDFTLTFNQFSITRISSYV